MSDVEIWKDVPGHGGHYEASSHGRLRSKARIVRKSTRHGKTAIQNYPARLIGGRNSFGYYRAHLCVDGKRYSVAVHRMVALAFHGEPEPGQECCHNNGDSGDNRPGNLRWDTHLENNRDRLRHGNYARGQDHHQAKFSAEFLTAVASGVMSKAEAMMRGMSHTHFYRVRAQGRAA